MHVFKQYLCGDAVERGFIYSSGTTFPKPGDKLVVHYICPGAQYTFFFLRVGLLVRWFVVVVVVDVAAELFYPPNKNRLHGDTQAKTTNKTMTQGRIDSKGKEPGPQIDSSYQRGLPFRREREGWSVGGWMFSVGELRVH